MRLLQPSASSKKVSVGKLNFKQRRDKRKVIGGKMQREEGPIMREVLNSFKQTGGITYFKESKLIETFCASSKANESQEKFL